MGPVLLAAAALPAAFRESVAAGLQRVRLTRPSGRAALDSRVLAARHLLGGSNEGAQDGGPPPVEGSRVGSRNPHCSGVPLRSIKVLAPRDDVLRSVRRTGPCGVPGDAANGASSPSPPRI